MHVDKMNCIYNYVECVNMWTLSDITGMWVYFSVCKYTERAWIFKRCLCVTALHVWLSCRVLQGRVFVTFQCLCVLVFVCVVLYNNLYVCVTVCFSSAQMAVLRGWSFWDLLPAVNTDQRSLSHLQHKHARMHTGTRHPSSSPHTSTSTWSNY